MRTEAPGGDWELIPNHVSEALALDRSGRIIGRYRLGRGPEAEVDTLSPVVVAFEGMVQDGLGERARPVSAVYGEKVLSLVQGEAVHVATVVRGRPDQELRRSMEEASAAIGREWGERLRAWSGLPDELEGLAEGLSPVVERTANRSPGEVEDPPNARGVFTVSSVDYVGGRVRFKAALFSAAFSPVRGAHVELALSRDLARLEGAEPAHALGEDGSVSLGTVPQGEEVAVGCLLEPLGTGELLVEGTVTFYDDANNPRHLELPRRLAHVAFPALRVDAIEFRPASRLGRGTDEATRSWRYPASLGGLDVLRTARTVLGTRGLVLGAGREDPGPPPSWSVEARGMAGPAPLSVTLEVTGGEDRRVSLVARSTDGSVTAGSLAEMRKLMEDAFFRRWKGQVELVEERSQVRPVASMGTDDVDVVRMG